MRADATLWRPCTLRLVLSSWKPRNLRLRFRRRRKSPGSAIALASHRRLVEPTIAGTSVGLVTAVGPSEQPVQGPSAGGQNTDRGASRPGFDWTKSMRRTVAAVVAAVTAVTIAMLWFQHDDAPRARDQAVSGAIVQYEASGRSLTLQTDAGARRFVVQEGAAVHAGARKLTLADLISASGCRAKVWYRDASDVWTAREIRISCRGMVPRPSPGVGVPQH